MVLRSLLAVVAVAVLSPLDSHAREGRTDSSFAGGEYRLAGTVLLAKSLAYSSDGSVFVSGVDYQVSVSTLANVQASIIKLRPDGTVDASFGDSGTASLTVPSTMSVASAVQSDGKLVVAFGYGSSVRFARFDSTGRLDPGFGTGGIARADFASPGACSIDAVRLLPAPDNSLLVVGSRYDFLSPWEMGCTAVARLAADGTPAASYRHSGTVALSLRPFDVRLLDGGGIELLGKKINGGFQVVRLRSNGDADETFAAQGTADLTPPAGVIVQYAVGGAILRDGSRILVTGSTVAGRAVLVKFGADGRIDTTFGSGGSAIVALPDRLLPWTILAVPDGGVLLSAGAGSEATSLVKLDAHGSPETSFGEQGLLRYFSDASGGFATSLMQPDGNLLFVGWRQAPGTQSYSSTSIPFVSRIQAVPDIVEFRNSTLGHYFMAYDGLEAKGIDAGAAGPGWSRTGQGFAPGGPSPVCRFYGTPGIGPNSHFYTAEPAECEAVKHDPGWTYEGIGFHATRVSSGSCPAPLIPVHRLYNNGAPRNDSNHRYVTDFSVVPSMQAQGWTYEGVVFCARP